ncbi:MAG: CehA/McbA family metallohydrolase [Candidatus Bathyarchaeia archaeon]
MLKIDIHVHTWFSDSTGSVEEVMETAQRKGLDGIAITDHDTIEGACEALKKKGSLIVIPGEEVETDRGEILALGIEKAIPRRLPIVEAINMVHIQGGLVIIPHPTVPFFNKLKEETMKKLSIDGLEVFSAATPSPRYFLRKNLEIVKSLKVSILAGSDSHLPETVGDAYTLVYSESRDLDSLLRAIKLGRTAIVPHPSNLTSKLKMYIKGGTHLLLRALNLDKGSVIYRSASADPCLINSKGKEFHLV